MPDNADTEAVCKYRWSPDEVIGHMPFCVRPSSHNAATTWCSADPSEPQTMNGEPSAAWHADHAALQHNDGGSDV